MHLKEQRSQLQLSLSASPSIFLRIFSGNAGHIANRFYVWLKRKSLRIKTKCNKVQMETDLRINHDVHEACDSNVKELKKIRSVWSDEEVVTLNK